MGKECEEGVVQPQSKQEVHWPEDGERFLADVYWLGDTFLAFCKSGIFMGNQSLSS